MPLCVPQRSLTRSRLGRRDFITLLGGAAAAGNCRAECGQTTQTRTYIEALDATSHLLRLLAVGHHGGRPDARGCEVAAAERPDTILMDLEMPVMDGWEGTRKLKGNSQSRDIPVIAAARIT